jgi:preprotein translocase subunit YajC
VSPAPLVVLLQAGGNGGSLLQSPIVPFGIMLVLIWLLIIRPQQRKQRDHEDMLKAIEKGDQVVTSGGLHGKVVGVTEDTLTLEIAALKGERVRVKVARSKVESRQAAGKGEES